MDHGKNNAEKKEMSKGKQTAINMGAQTVSFALSLLINLLLTPVIVNRIGSEVYGFFGLASNLLDYVSVITAAVNAMATRFITVAYTKGDIKSANEYFTSVTAVNIAISMALLIPAGVLAAKLEWFFDVPKSHLGDIKLLWAFCFGVFFVNLIFSRCDAAMFAANRLDITAGINMTGLIMKAALLLAAYTLLTPRISYLGAAAFISAVYIAAMRVRAKRKTAPALRFDRALYKFSVIKELVKVGIWNSVSQLSQLLFTGLDLLIANLFIGAEEMGILSVAKTVPTMIIGLIGVIAGTFYPIMTIAYTKDRDALLKETFLASKMCGFICSVPVMGIAVFGGAFFSLWLPSLPSSEISRIQLLSILTLLPQMMSIYLFPLYQINTLTCKVKLPALVDCGIGAANILIVYALLKTTNLGLYAIAGVSSVLLVFRILIFVPIYAAHNVNLQKTAFYPLLARGMVLNAVTGFLFYMIQSFMPKGSWAALVIFALLAAAVGYSAGFFVIFSKEERKKVRSFVLKKIGRADR